MEIGQHHVDGAEAVARRDEDGGLAGEGANDAVFAGGAFQQPQRGRAGGDDAAARAPRRVERIRRFRAHRAPFRMHDMAFGIVGLDRQEGAGADVQRDDMHDNTPRLQPLA